MFAIATLRNQLSRLLLAPATTTQLRFTSGGTKKLSGYTLYVKEMSKHKDIVAKPAGDRLSVIGALWKQMSDAQKAEYNTKAQQLNAQAAAAAAAAPATVAAALGTTKSRKAASTQPVAKEPRKMSAYQWYVIEMMQQEDIRKMEYQPDRLKKIASEWKKLTEDQKNEYKKTVENRVRQPKPAAAKKRPADAPKVKSGWLLFCEGIKKGDEYQKLQKNERRPFLSAKWQLVPAEEKKKLEAQAREMNAKSGAVPARK